MAWLPPPAGQHSAFMAPPPPLRTSRGSPRPSECGTVSPGMCATAPTSAHTAAPPPPPPHITAATLKRFPGARSGWLVDRPDPRRGGAGARPSSQMECDFFPRILRLCTTARTTGTAGALWIAPPPPGNGHPDSGTGLLPPPTVSWVAVRSAPTASIRPLTVMRPPAR